VQDCVDSCQQQPSTAAKGEVSETDHTYRTPVIS
jgi:hypothetical protein